MLFCQAQQPCLLSQKHGLLSSKKKTIKILNVAGEGKFGLQHVEIGDIKLPSPVMNLNTCGNERVKILLDKSVVRSKLGYALLHLGSY